MTIGILLILAITVIIPLLKGFWNNQGFDLMLEFKLFSNPYYNIGISFIAYPEPDHIEEEFTIGLFFVNFVIVFYKEYE
jgi:hypothetical protein